MSEELKNSVIFLWSTIGIAFVVLVLVWRKLDKKERK